MNKGLNMNKFLKKYQTHFLVILTSILIILIIYAIKGIYPFGDMTIANGDMGQSYIPFYVFLHDVIHNSKSIFYDYTLGLGSNMFGAFIVDGLLNPTAYIVLLNTRENVPYMLSFVLMAKIAFISLTSYILFNNIYKNNKFYNFLFSILYAFSGYVLMYNTNIMWLDIVGLFPLFILSIKYMFETEKIHWYSIILALILIYNYNLAYMICLFIILLIPMYIFLAIPKEKRKQAILNLIIATCLGVGLSAFAILPSFHQVITSFRINNVKQLNNANDFLLYKMSILLFYSLPIYGFSRWLWNKKEDKQLKKIYLTAFIMVGLIPILFEKVNLLWHSGSYELFPYRYGFIPILILSLGSLKEFSKIKPKNNKSSNKFIKPLLFVLFIITLFIGINNSLYINANTPALVMLPIACGFIEITCLLTVTILCITYIKEKTKVQKFITLILVISEIFIYSYAYIGVKSENIQKRELSDKGVFLSYKIQEQFKIKNDLYRLKDQTALTTENCSLIYNTPSIGTFLHIISQEQVIGMRELGYSHLKTKIHNYGGTIFSDALYGVKYILTPKELSPKIYKYIDTIDDNIHLYEYKNTLPIGITYDNEIEEVPYILNVFETQNYLYKNIFNKQEDIIEIYNQNTLYKKQDEFTIEVKKNSQLYLYSQSIISQIYVNDIPTTIPVINDSKNQTYGNHYYNGILDLGNYENQKVTIKLISENGMNNVLIGILDIDKYNQIFEEYNDNINISIKKNKIKITGNSDKNTNLFIPINYDKGWHLSKNSHQQTKIKRIYTNFLVLEINKGKVDLELEFIPPLFKIGTIISLISILLMLIISYIKRKIENSKLLLNIAYYSFLLVAILFFIRIYIIGIIENFIN